MNKRPADSRLPTRRGVLGGALGLGGLGIVGLDPLLSDAGGGGGAIALSPVAPPLASDSSRAAKAYAVRVQAATNARQRGETAAVANGDEEAVPGRAACYSKGLPHGPLGEVDPESYRQLLQALRSGDPADFERIPLGGFLKLANPQAAFTFDLIGPDSAQPQLALPPRFGSAEQAAELVELYWHALVRDVPFSEYEENAAVAQAAADLTAQAGFRGPRVGGAVTPGTLFRGPTAGDLVGPFLSQFLWRALPYTPILMEQRIRTAAPALDFVYQYDDWWKLQNGALSGVNRFDPVRRYVRSGRDLGEYAHRDFTYQAFLGACLAALKMGAQPDGGNPYKHSRTQSAFTSFGQPYLLYLLAVVTHVSLHACWFQKWLVHRRLRPEELAGTAENHLLRRASHPLHADLFESAGLNETRRKWRTALLPQAYPEGCPAHPSYPSGHAVIAGACTTVLKACLDERHVVPDPVVASSDGLRLVPYQGPTLTIGHEFDKLASNIAIGRDFAGIHWRSDAVEGLRFGEAVAIAVLDEMRLTGNELFQGYSLTRFDGSRESIG